MALLYVGLGAWTLWSASHPSGDGLSQLPPYARRILGSVLIGYGLLRLVRIYHVHFCNQSTVTVPKENQ